MLLCVTLGIEPLTRRWDGKGSPFDYFVSKNLHRQHLDEGQLGDVVGAAIASIKNGFRELPNWPTGGDEGAGE